MSKALATYFATVNDIPDTEFKVEILEDGPIKKVSVNGTVYDEITIWAEIRSTRSS